MFRVNIAKFQLSCFARIHLFRGIAMNSVLKSTCRAMGMAAMFVGSLGAAHAAAVSGQGTWETTLQARDLDGNLSNGPEAYFDSDLGVTWLADANFAYTSGYVSRFHGPGGNMVFGEALLWVGSLNIGGVTGWRLPTVAFIDAQHLDASTSELTHMYSVTLGNTGSLSNTGPFLNLERHKYWLSSTESFKAVHFNTANGSLDAEHAYRDQPDLVWAVRTGDVGVPMPASPAPEPGAMVLGLMGLGLVGLMGARRRATR